MWDFGFLNINSYRHTLLGLLLICGSQLRYIQHPNLVAFLRLCVKIVLFPTFRQDISDDWGHVWSHFGCNTAGSRRRSPVHTQPWYKVISIDCADWFWLQTLEALAPRVLLPTASPGVHGVQMCPKIFTVTQAVSFTLPPAVVVFPV